MKMIKFSLVAFVVVSLCATAFADSTMIDSVIVKDSVVNVIDSASVVAPVEPVGTESGISVYSILTFLIGVYELVVRLFPTTKNYSFISLVYSLLNYVVPNFKKNGGKH